MGEGRARGSMGETNQDKRTLYVGGLEENVDEPILQSAFIPFGDIVDVNIPIEQTTQKHRGFGFITFEEREDAKAAIENMNNSELYGRVMRVNIAKPMKAKAEGSGKAVWADEHADKFYDENIGEMVDHDSSKDADLYTTGALQPAGGANRDL